MKRISVFGLGYVGAVSSACLARDGFRVVGVDVNEEKIRMMARGKAPIIEHGLEELINKGIQSKLLSVTTSVREAIETTDASLICVGTPSSPNGGLDLSYVERVCKEIGLELKRRQKDHVIVLRSTVLPGSTRRFESVVRESAQKDVHIAFNPEFLREGSAIRDYDSPPYTIVGTTDRTAEATLREIYAPVNAEIIVTQPEIAELIKYASNAWHAVKISFANEIGRIAKANSVDGRKVMEILTKDTKLNISHLYMRPGFAYGGSCLPKDVRALTFFAGRADIKVPLLNSLTDSNRSQVNLVAQRILETGKRKVGILGLAFKSGTDDLRESPAVELAENLIGKGRDLLIFDPPVYEAKLIGSNKEYIDTHIPHLSSLLAKSGDEIVEHAEIVVITHGAPEFREVVAKLPPHVIVLDLVGSHNPQLDGKSYDGIAW